MKFKRLSPELKEKVLKNMGDRVKDISPSALENYELSSLFLFEGSPEGLEYWANLNKQQ